jgi:hypothetical protein
VEHGGKARDIGTASAKILANAGGSLKDRPAGGHARTRRPALFASRRSKISNRRLRLIGAEEQLLQLLMLIGAPYVRFCRNLCAIPLGAGAAGLDLLQNW